MVNVYIFRDDSSTPAGWTEIASGYRERLCLCNGALETGGSYTHDHSISNWNCSDDSGTFTNIFGAGSNACAYAHNHTSGSPIVSSEYHLPSAKCFRLVYRSTSGWNGTVPSGSIVFNESVPSGWSRTENGSSKFIWISATAGGYGGSDSHAHTVSGTTSPSSYCVDLYRWDQTYYPYASKCSHTHTYSGTSNTSAHTGYYYWACGLVKASSDTYVKVNCYLLFDAAPNSLWEVVTGANNRYLRISSTNSITTGGSYLSLVHDHTMGTINVSTYDCSGDFEPDWGNNNTYTVGSHTHAISFALASATATPAYVKLTLARAKYDFPVPVSVSGSQIFML